jgi:hypothetical protein
MNMKAAASLTGSLLARKGAAYPAAYSAPSTAPSAAPADTDGESQPQRAYNDPRVIASAPPQPEAPAAQDAPPAHDAPAPHDPSGTETSPGAEAGPATPAPIPPVAGEEALSIPQVMDKMGRVRLSVRLDPDRYLRVKMASARTRWSAQDIVIAALDRYLGGSSDGNAKTESGPEDGDDGEDSVN